MPITLPPISRRHFLRGSLAAGVAAALSPRWLSAAPPVDPHRLALLSDIHLDVAKDFGKMDAVPFPSFAQAASEIIALPTRPFAALVNGDLTHHQGNPEDYVTVLDALHPLREAGLPIHLTMGNHDHRANFLAAAFPADPARQKGNDRIVNLFETPRANVIMLDSLGVTAQSFGALGARQLTWLAKTLDARPNKPAIVFVHHDPILVKSEKVTGLTDTKALFDLLQPRKHVKALVYGHTHAWDHSQRDDGLHLVNLPPTAWTFKPGLARGWVDLTLAEAGATFELRCLDPKHEKHGEKLELKWR
jgi:Icc protein